MQWALIERTDEYQLVSFIIANKAYHFVVYGFIQLFQNTAAYMDCVLEDVGEQHPCSDHAPGRHIGYVREFVMEMIRMATALWAYALLRRSRGDKEQIIELERRRLKLAPGSEPVGSGLGLGLGLGIGLRLGLGIKLGLGLGFGFGFGLGWFGFGLGWFGFGLG